MTSSKTTSSGSSRVNHPITAAPFSPGHRTQLGPLARSVNTTPSPWSCPVQSHDHTPGQNHQELTYLPVPFPKTPPKEPRFAALRAWWNKAWDVDGVLYDMWEDILSAPE